MQRSKGIAATACLTSVRHGRPSPQIELLLPKPSFPPPRAREILLWCSAASLPASRSRPGSQPTTCCDASRRSQTCCFETTKPFARHLNCIQLRETCADTNMADAWQPSHHGRRRLPSHHRIRSHPSAFGRGRSCRLEAHRMFRSRPDQH